MKHTQIFDLDGEEKSFEQLTISELGKLNPEAALEEQIARYKRLKAEAREVRAACRLKNMTIEQLQEELAQANSKRPVKRKED